MQSGEQIKVLVVDDSAFMRLMLKGLLERDPAITVVGTAADGLLAVEKVAHLKPDVVTMDVEMPRLDGLGALRLIMERTPCPVVMVSSLTQHGAAATMEALELGAVDFIPKPAGNVNRDFTALEAGFTKKVKLAASIPRERLRQRSQKRERPHVPAPVSALRPAKLSHITIVAASTGGPGALYQFMEALPADYPGGILIVQHMPAGFTTALAGHLNQRSELRVREAADGDRLEDGLALVAPGGGHVRLTSAMRVLVDWESAPVHGVRPAADVTMMTLPGSWGARCVTIILSGMGRDGAQGAQRLKQMGATVWVQDEASCAVFGMPGAAVALGVVERLGPPEQLGQWLSEHVSGGM